MCSRCTNAPDHAMYLGPANGYSPCLWQCVTGYFLQANECVSCPVGTFSSFSGTLARNLTILNALVTCPVMS